MFFKNSRYEKVKDYKFRRLDGSEVFIKKKRMIPETKGHLIHTVQEGERTDLLAQRYYHDPLVFWKLADGNSQMKPENLVDEAGARIIVPPNDPS